MTHEDMVKGFNLWMKEYTENPELFQREYSSIKEFLAETLEGKEPTYGQSCAATLFRYAEKAKAA